ncbi:hypothetical protein GALL_548020 [mine drainage metagenome]|uniref:Uncharacterized protein n=1 Tax=mine drainage metagenome TaxID=410659 RepID=A0A1J5NY19_9ZZZZ
MRWSDFPDDNRIAWAAMIAMTALVLGLGLDAGLSLKWSAILSAMLDGTWFALTRTAQDPRWSVAYAWSLLTGTSLALVADAGSGGPAWLEDRDVACRRIYRSPRCGRA